MSSTVSSHPLLNKSLPNSIPVQILVTNSTVQSHSKSHSLSQSQSQPHHPIPMPQPQQSVQPESVGCQVCQISDLALQIVCATCQRSWHLKCYQLDQLPEEKDWQCNICKQKDLEAQTRKAEANRNPAFPLPSFASLTQEKEPTQNKPFQPKRFLTANDKASDFLPSPASTHAPHESKQQLVNNSSASSRRLVKDCNSAASGADGEHSNSASDSGARVNSHTNHNIKSASASVSTTSPSSVKASPLALVPLLSFTSPPRRSKRKGACNTENANSSDSPAELNNSNRAAKKGSKSESVPMYDDTDEIEEIDNSLNNNNKNSLSLDSFLGTSLKSELQSFLNSMSLEQREAFQICVRSHIKGLINFSKRSRTNK